MLQILIKKFQQNWQAAMSEQLKDIETILYWIVHKRERKQKTLNLFLISSSLQRGVFSKNENSEFIEKCLYEILEKHLKISVINVNMHQKIKTLRKNSHETWKFVIFGHYLHNLVWRIFSSNVTS